MSGEPIEIRVSQPTAGSDEPTFPPYNGPAFFSYGFRPFFLGAAVFAGVAVPVWILILSGAIGSSFLYAPREWHVHEMLFGFLPAVMTGFLLTAIPNWTGRTPLRGMPLASLWMLWLAGRLVVAVSTPAPVLAAVIDASFLVMLAALVWREIAAAGMWNRSPIGALITLYAAANMLFHTLALHAVPTDVPERLALSILFMLLTVIGGRVTPAFTGEYLKEQRITSSPAPFSLFDKLSMLLVLIAVLAWNVQPAGDAAGVLFIAAGVLTLVRLSRWRGWMAWREPLVFILTVGYGWVGLSLLALGGASLGMLPAANAVHVLTTGAVGTMTLAILTRASLGHTGRTRHAGLMTVVIYVLVNVGAILRIVSPASDAPTALTHLVLGLSALAWSGAYLLFALVYGSILVRPSLHE
ncbi:MAG TPA: NnrS family protein [Nitrospira sp.]|nr:NnrS family protein [Nitrospira sp.]